jgi:tetratricopeptide (TPR) repeat protein
MKMVPAVIVLPAISPEKEALEAKHHRFRRGGAAVWLVLLFLAAACPMRAQNDAAWADFQQKAAAWRALPIKSAIPEEVRLEGVKAEDAFQKKRLAEAAADYDAGLKIDPVWPDGYSKAASIYAELDEYDKAIWHIRAYLELVPDAPDAESARGQIVAWGIRSSALESVVYLDPVSKLIWPRRDSGNKMTQAGAVNYCGNLDIGGFAGWRLPTLLELKTIYDKSKKGDTVSCNGGTLDGAHIRDTFKLSCNEGMVWEADLPYSNGTQIYGACFGFRKYGGKWEYFPGSLSCPVLCVRNSGE